VQSETGQSIGHFKQPRDGNVDVRPEELPAMRLSARVEDKDEIARRKAALDALIGKEAPALPKNGWLNSKPLAWNDLAGKTVVVEFWSHWSYASDAELKRLAEVRQAWLDDGVTGRVILGIHTAGTGRETIARLVEEKQLGFPIVIDAARPDGGFAWGDLFDAFAVRQIPVTVVVDGAGRIVANGRLEDMLAKAAELGGTK
jgi:thiol-disulfide isomerase/thioredoxin